MPIYKNDKGYRVQVNYTDSFGNKKVIVKQNKSTSTLKGAKQVEAEIIANINTYVNGNKDITLDELYNFYYSIKENEVKLATLQSTDRRYKRYIQKYLGHKKVRNITLSDLQNWKNEILKLNLCNKYMNEIYGVFNCVLNTGVKYDHLDKNLLSRVGRFKKPVYEVKKVDFWTKEEFDKFICVARKHCEEWEKQGKEDYLLYWAYYVMFNIMFYCGCRKGEVYPLQWTDIDFNRNVVSITKGLTYKVKGTEENYVLSTPKTRSSIRDIVMPKQLVDILKEHYARYDRVYGFTDQFFVCGGVVPIRDTVLENFKNKCSAEAGVKRIRIHDFRHSHASLLINSGVNIAVVSKRLGHASIKETLDTYSHMYQSKEDEAVALINSLE